MKRLVILYIAAFCTVSTFAQKTYRDHIRMGNYFFRQLNTNEAEVNYQRSVNSELSVEGLFNLANIQRLMGNDSTALENYKKALNLSINNKKKSASIFHNIGNLYYSQGVGAMKSRPELTNTFLTKAIEAYKSALRYNPADNETRYNLAKAQYLLNKNQQNQNQDQNQNQENQEDQKGKKDQQNSEDQKDEKKDNQENHQDKKDPEKKDPKNQDQNQDKKENQNNSQNGESNPQNGQKKTEMDDKTAEQLLNAALQDEKKIQRRLNQRTVPIRKLEKDW